MKLGLNLGLLLALALAVATNGQDQWAGERCVRIYIGFLPARTCQATATGSLGVLALAHPIYLPVLSWPTSTSCNQGAPLHTTVHSDHQLVL